MRRWRFLTIFTSILGVISLAVAAPAGAASFYDPPSPLPTGSNGDVIRHEPAQFFLDPAKLIPAPASAQRIMYRSTDEHGAPIAVTGTVLTPIAAWTGPGPRPIIGYAAGTQGLGDQCAPSKAMAAGLEYEGPFIAGLLSRGYAVVISDYEGLGTPGLHTYVNRKAEGYAVLDAIRAAQRLPEAGLPADGPVALSGYSQGGGASAAAAELQPAYAPELKLKGAYAGAVPADLGAVAALGDGKYAVGFTLFAVASMNYSYHELNVPALLNDKGKQVLREVETECTADALFRHAFTRTADLTVDGRPITVYLGQEPFASVLRRQRLGLTPPKVPVLVAHSTADDIVPFGQGRDMARSWCAEGATVQFDALSVSTHVGGAIAVAPAAFTWLDQLLHGRPAPSNCGSF